MKRIITALAVLIMGSTCPTESPSTDPYCDGSPLPAMAIPAIEDGLSSCTATACTRRSTVRVSATRSTGAITCSGTVVGPRAVLTAAHCQNNHINDGYIIWAGGLSDDSKLTDKRSWSSTGAARGYHDFVHPEFPYNRSSSGFGIHDMMLIIVDSDLPPPYAIPYQSIQTDECDSLIGQGFGKTDDQDEGTAGKLHEAEFRVISPRADNETTKTITVEGTPGSYSALGGDSGGPMYAVMVDNTVRLAGVISSGVVGSSTTVQKLTRDKWNWIQEYSALTPVEDPCYSETATESATDTITNGPQQTEATTTLTVTGYMRATERPAVFGITDGPATGVAQAVTLRCGPVNWEVWDGATDSWEAQYEIACNLNEWYAFELDINVTAGTFAAAMGTCRYYDTFALDETSDFRTGAPATGLDYYSYINQGGGTTELHSVTWTAP